MVVPKSSHDRSCLKKSSPKPRSGITISESAKILSPTTNNHDYVTDTQSNKYRSLTLILGLQEASGCMWLQILIGHLIQTRLLKGWVFDRNSDYCVQASWQGPLFLEITRPWNLATWENDFEPEFGRLCAGFLAGAFLFFQK
jgi:hypothetical protein